MTSHQADELKALYRHYIDRCNAHHFEDLSEFVAEDVEVNGYPHGLGGYIAGLLAVIAAFPDYRWNLRHLVVEGDWLAAHFIDTGMHMGTFHGVARTRGCVMTQELAMYRIADSKIAEFWGTAEKRRSPPTTVDQGEEHGDELSLGDRREVVQGAAQRSDTGGPGGRGRTVGSLKFEDVPEADGSEQIEEA